MTLNAIMKQFFDENEFQYLSDRIAIIREDGISLYSNSGNDFESATISALVSGLWQAAKSLNSLVETKDDFLDFRMAFDSSSNGIYILPFQLRSEEYYFCSIYKDRANPAKLKRDVRLLKENLEVYLSSIELEKESPSGREGYLFKDISDEEIDRMFDVAGAN